MGLAAGDTGRLAPGLVVGTVPVGGLTPAEARARLTGQPVAVPQVTVQAGKKTWTVPGTRLGWQVDPAASVAAAVRASGDRDLWQKVRGMVGQAPTRTLPLVTRVDEVRARAALEALTRDLATNPKNAAIFFDKTARRYALKPDQPGRRPNAAAAARAFAADPSQTRLSLPVTEWPAEHTAAELRPHVERGNRLMRPLTVKLQGTDRSGALTALQVADLYWVRENGIEPDEKTLRAVFDRLTGAVDRPAQNARFRLEGGKLVKVREEAGRVTDRQAALAAFRKAVLDPAASSVVFASKASRPSLRLADLPNPDTLELIASGTSTYHGSSAERRTNVAVAAANIHGYVVPEGGEFSFLSALGSITPENGFVGGLIISGGRTVEGLGGGVCQVSTTAFRALYQAGLPVTERHQHSYRVGYYEPEVGFEAAVYDPGLDLRLKNDTDGPLFIKTVNDDAKSRLEVQVWGIKPERTVTVSPAVIHRYTPHPPAQYVVGRGLAPGVVRQVDWAKDGYDLSIIRTIKDKAGTRTDQTKTSYQPWRAVYEVGPR